MSDVLTLGTPEYAQRLTELSTMDLMFAYNREEANYSKDFVLIALLGEAERRDVELASLRAELAEKQAYVLRLERALGEAKAQVELDAAFGKPTRMELEAQIERLLSRTGSSPSAGEVTP